MRKIKSLYYHNPKAQGFEKMVVYYKNKGYRFISIEELYTILSEKKQIREKLVFVSFDDGWRGNLQLIPIIEKYNVPICIFVATEPLKSGNYWWEYVKNERGLKYMIGFKNLSYSKFYQELEGFKKRNILSRSSMTVDEMITICKHPLITIQSHTVNHPILTNSPDDILEMELRDSKSQLEGLTDNRIFAFSYPNGSLSTREVDACKKHYKIAFTTEQRHIDLNDDIFLLPRYALTGDFYRDLLKVWGIWKFIKKLL